MNTHFLFYYYFSGFLINFISAPVISAFTSAVSIQVATSQVKGLLGLDVSTSHEYSNNISHENFIREIGGSCRRTILFGREKVYNFMQWILSLPLHRQKRGGERANTRSITLQKANRSEILKTDFPILLNYRGNSGEKINSFFLKCLSNRWPLCGSPEERYPKTGPRALGTSIRFPPSPSLPLPTCFEYFFSPTYGMVPYSRVVPYSG